MKMQVFLQRVCFGVTEISLVVRQFDIVMALGMLSHLIQGVEKVYYHENGK